MINVPNPLHGEAQKRHHRIALAYLVRGIDPGDRLLTPLLEPENLHAQLPRQKFHRARHAKAAGQPHACASPSTAGQVSSGPAGETWPGENVDEPRSPSFTTGPSTATFEAQNCRSCSGPPWILRLSQFRVQGIPRRPATAFAARYLFGRPVLWARLASIPPVAWFSVSGTITSENLRPVMIWLCGLDRRACTRRDPASARPSCRA